jgi:hypothetical protein
MKQWPTAGQESSVFQQHILEQVRADPRGQSKAGVLCRRLTRLTRAVQYAANRDVEDKARLRALKQQAKDAINMLSNLERQKVREPLALWGIPFGRMLKLPWHRLQEIAYLLSGEKAPPRELVRLAAAR